MPTHYLGSKSHPQDVRFHTPSELFLESRKIGATRISHLVSGPSFTMPEDTACCPVRGWFNNEKDMIAAK